MLPLHWQRGRQMAALLVFLLATIITYLGRSVGRADQLDGWWLRARFSAREALHPKPVDPDIVLVDMDDKCAIQWQEPFIAWGGHLAAAVNRMRLGGARVIALDWTQPQRTDIWFNGKFSKNDELLATALSQVPSVVMVKETLTGRIGKADEWIRPTPEILYSLPHADPDPDVNLGYPELGNEGAQGQTGTRDSVVTAVTPGFASDKGVEASFAARMVEHYLGAQGQLRNGAWVIPGKVTLPLRDNGSLLINYHRPSDLGHPDWPSAFAHYSLYDIAQPSAQPDERFKNKIVIVGATYTGLNDQHYIPFVQGWDKLTRPHQISGPEVQANFVRTLLSGNPIHEPEPIVIWLLALAVSLIGLVAFYFMRWAPAAIVSLLTAVAWIGLAFGLFAYADYALPIMLPLAGLLVTGGLMGGYRALREERERAEVLKLWGRYQDPRIVNYLLQNQQARGGEGQEKIVTVLFADLKNFTKTVESLAPGEALQVLNRYLALLNEVILEYAGAVDKYLGDGLMAQWGAPEPWSELELNENHAAAAVKACLEIERRAGELTASIAGNKDVTFGLRLTLHSGPVVVGWVGADRIEYTIIGDTVNVTSRLQETAKQLDCEFLISESTYEYVCDWVRTGKEAEVEIRGRKQPLRVFEVLGVQEPMSGTQANGVAASHLAEKVRNTDGSNGIGQSDGQDGSPSSAETTELVSP